MPGLANQIKALPWVANGIDDTEREAAQMLVDAANHYPDTLKGLLQNPWATDHDITAAETSAIYGIRWSAKHAPALSEQMLKMLWVQDGITEAEGEVIRWLELIGRNTKEFALSMTGMPFLQSFEQDDGLALRAIGRIVWDDDLLEVLRTSDVYRAGITDHNLTRIIAAGTIWDTAELRRMLRDNYASMEVWDDGTDFSPELRISIVRAPNAIYRPDTMTGLVHNVEWLEDFMQTPLPTRHLVVVFSDYATVRAGSDGTQHGFATGLWPMRERPTQYVPGKDVLHSTVVHEIGHLYFGNEMQYWLNEFGVQMFEYFYRLDGRNMSEMNEETMPFYSYPQCEVYDLETLEGLDFSVTENITQFRCNHYLGYQMARELLGAVGSEEMVMRLQELYRLSLGVKGFADRIGIAEVREVFHDQPEIVERYWSGAVNAPENR